MHRHPQKKSPATGPAYAQVVAGLQGEIRYEEREARRWTRQFFPRPRRKGWLPGPVCRWLAADLGRAVSKSLVVRREDAVLFIRRRSPHSRDSISLLVELVTEEAAAANRRHGKLTRRENEVMRWVAEGKSNANIAIILGLTLGTVGKHLQACFAKLGVENRTAAAAAFLRESAGD